MVENHEFVCCLKYCVMSHLAEEDLYCEVRPSRMKSAGLGLFAKVLIPQNTVICKYQGRLIRTREAMRLDDKSYLMRLGEQCYIDAKDDYQTVARYINDCRNKNLYNVFFLKSFSEKCAFVITTRDIQPDEEIYVDYGKWYWVGKSPMKLITTTRPHQITSNES